MIVENTGLNLVIVKRLTCEYERKEDGIESARKHVEISLGVKSTSLKHRR